MQYYQAEESDSDNVYTSYIIYSNRLLSLKTNCHALKLILNKNSVTFLQHPKVTTFT